MEVRDQIFTATTMEFWVAAGPVLLVWPWHDAVGQRRWLLGGGQRSQCTHQIEALKEATAHKSGIFLMPKCSWWLRWGHIFVAIKFNLLTMALCNSAGPFLTQNHRSFNSFCNWLIYGIIHKIFLLGALILWSSMVLRYIIALGLFLNIIKRGKME